MKDKLAKQQAEDIIKKLEETIAKGPWEESNFLKAIGKDLVKIREGLLNYIKTQDAESAKLTTLMVAPTIKNHQQEIFVSLYSADGRNIQSWERIVTNLPRQTISRPIYEDEERIKTLIKSKENKHNEAYVSIFIDKKDILTLPEDKTPHDKLGNVLLTLKASAIQLENINKFIHSSGVYHYFHGRLVKSM